MKVFCPVCNRMGILQVRGNSQRVGHYVGYKGRTSIIEWHLVKNGKDGKEMVVKNKRDDGFFSQSNWAGGSVWYERRLRKAEVAGSNPAQSIPIWV